MTRPIYFLGLLVSCTSISSAFPDELPDPAKIENDGAVIGEIILERSDVFDLSDPEENNWLYRLANKLHIVTRENVIRKQLLLESGDAYSKKLSDESERLLRQNSYLFDADILPVSRNEGVVDLVVKTRDVWTLGPDISASRTGGENTSRIGIEELNFLGLGQSIRVFHEEGVERRSDSIEFFDRQLGNSWTSGFAHFADNSDGHHRQLSLVRPFYSLDARWSLGGSAIDNERRGLFYRLGNQAAEYQQYLDYGSLWGGWSAGLRDGWVKRWQAGVVFSDLRFSDVTNPALPALIPANRKLVYPFVSLEILEDRYVTAANRDQIGRTEDFHTGTRFTATLGWSDERFEADRDALIWSSTFSRGFGDLDKQFLMLGAAASGRHESGRSANSRASFTARYYKVQSEKRLFYATLSATAGHALDVDNLVELGGDSGLRGYPLRYQAGESKLLFTIEQRYFTDWYPFRLVRVGGAIFADAGRVWGDNPINETRYGWLTDVGFGLRLGRTRSSSGKMIHIDVAFPLGGDASIDDVQFLLESKRSF
ncbi:MAG: hypothetical protein AAFN50_06495 [Pseudomonadota bacterium]